MDNWEIIDRLSNSSDENNSDDPEKNSKEILCNGLPKLNVSDEIIHLNVESQQNWKLSPDFSSSESDDEITPIIQETIVKSDYINNNIKKSNNSYLNSLLVSCIIIISGIGLYMCYRY